MDNLVYKIEKIVRHCGEIVLNSKNDSLDIEYKDGAANIVTRYDKMIQEILKNELLKILPDANFIGEEEDLHKEISTSGYTYIVDPIDGTMNFSRGLSLSAISVALLKDGIPYIGVCYNPYLDEMFIAQKNMGAYLNNKQIKVSDKNLNEGLLLIGSSPYSKELHKESIELLYKYSTIATDFRRVGAAVLDLCNIACGRAELYIELKLQPWDYAAGTLIVQEAGGNVTNMNQEEMKFNKPSSIVASNNKEDYFKYI